MTPAKLVAMDAHQLTPGRHYIVIHTAEPNGACTARLMELTPESVVMVDETGALCTMPMADVKKYK